FNLTKTRSITKGEILEAVLTVDVSDDGHFEHASLSDFVVVKAVDGIAVARAPLQPEPPFLILQLAPGDFSPPPDTAPSPQDPNGLFAAQCGGFGPVLTGCASPSPLANASPSGSPTSSSSPTASGSPAASTSPSGSPTTPPTASPTDTITPPPSPTAAPTQS